MTTSLLAAVALLGLTLTACGADDCVDGVNRIRKKVESCGAQFVVRNPSNEDNLVCTEALAKKASDDADAIDALDCATIREDYK